MTDGKQNADSKQFLVRVAATAAAVVLILYLGKIWYVDVLWKAGSGPTDRAAPTAIPHRPSRPVAPAKTPGASGEAQVVDWRNAADHYGRYATVEGRIVATHNSGKACFLNFHADYKRYFTAVIFASAFDRFPPSPESFYSGKHVRVTGTIKEYKGKPEIVLSDPGQIQVMD